MRGKKIKEFKENNKTICINTKSEIKPTEAIKKYI